MFTDLLVEFSDFAKTASAEEINTAASNILSKLAADFDLSDQFDRYKNEYVQRQVRAGKANPYITTAKGVDAQGNTTYAAAERRSAEELYEDLMADGRGMAFITFVKDKCGKDPELAEKLQDLITKSTITKEDFQRPEVKELARVFALTGGASFGITGGLLGALAAPAGARLSTAGVAGGVGAGIGALLGYLAGRDKGATDAMLARGGSLYPEIEGEELYRNHFKLALEAFEDLAKTASEEKLEARSNLCLENLFKEAKEKEKNPIVEGAKAGIQYGAGIGGTVAAVPATVGGMAVAGLTAKELGVIKALLAGTGTAVGATALSAGVGAMYGLPIGTGVGVTNALKHSNEKKASLEFDQGREILDQSFENAIKEIQRAQIKQQIKQGLSDAAGPMKTTLLLGGVPLVSLGVPATAIALHNRNKEAESADEAFEKFANAEELDETLFYFEQLASLVSEDTLEAVAEAYLHEFEKVANDTETVPVGAATLYGGLSGAMLGANTDLAKFLGSLRAAVDPPQEKIDKWFDKSQAKYDKGVEHVKSIVNISQIERDNMLDDLEEAKKYYDSLVKSRAFPIDDAAQAAFTKAKKRFIPFTIGGAALGTGIGAGASTLANRLNDDKVAEIIDAIEAVDKISEFINEACEDKVAEIIDSLDKVAGVLTNVKDFVGRFKIPKPAPAVATDSASVAQDAAQAAQQATEEAQVAADSVVGQKTTAWATKAKNMMMNYPAMTAVGAFGAGMGANQMMNNVQKRRTPSTQTGPKVYPYYN